jgi:predicted small metal-binding protein
MYKIICRDLGFDCDFKIKKISKKTIIETLARHLFTSHAIYYPKNEISEFVDKQNNIIPESNLESNHGFDAFYVKKEFSRRKNYP